MTDTLRTATPADLDALCALEARTFDARDRFPRRNLRRLLASGSTRVLLCEIGGQLAGSSILSFRKGARVARLYSIAVDPAQAGKGVGRALISAAVEDARHRGCDRLRLEVRASNARAISLYERNGFRLRNTKKGYYADGETALVYERSLGST